MRDSSGGGFAPGTGRANDHRSREGVFIRPDRDTDIRKPNQSLPAGYGRGTDRRSISLDCVALPELWARGVVRNQRVRWTYADPPLHQTGHANDGLSSFSARAPREWDTEVGGSAKEIQNGHL